MNIIDARNWLDGLIDYEKGFQKHKMSQYDTGIIARILDELSPNWLDIPLIHIAGTKGKGSVAGYIMRGLLLKGKRTGLFTSPHYFRLNERISIDGKSITDDDLADLITRLRDTISHYSLTYFESLTLLCMIYFIEEGCDYIILETGLGGRLDSTNFHPSPVLCVITSISFDHTSLLGNSLGEIAREKAGIIKRGCPLLCVNQDAEAYAVLKEVSEAKHALFTYLPDIQGYTLYCKSARGSQIILERAQMRLTIAQWGEAYIENFLTSISALELLDLPLDDRQSKELAALRFPFHIQYQNNIILDVSHNGASIELLLQSIQDYLYRDSYDLYLGILADKELDRIAQVIARYRDKIRRLFLFPIPEAHRPDGINLMHDALSRRGISAGMLDDITSVQPVSGILSVYTGSFYSIPVLAPHLGFPSNSTV